jgi:hypothetical protein
MFGIISGMFLFVVSECPSCPLLLYPNDNNCCESFLKVNFPKFQKASNIKKALPFVGASPDFALGPSGERRQSYSSAFEIFLAQEKQ